MNTGTRVLNILLAQNINTEKDLDDYFVTDYCPVREFTEGKDLIYGREDAWIGDVFRIIKEDLDNSSKRLLKNEEKYISFDDDSENILKYACMFPTTSINLKEKFDERDTDRGWTYYTIPKDFFRSLIRHRNLIQNDVYKILPEIIKKTGDSECDMQDQYSIWSLSGREDYFQGRLVNKDVNILSSNGIFLSNDKIEKLYYEFPWLYGVSVEDYIDIVTKNKTLYDSYCKTILKFTEAVHNGNYSSVKQEMEEANISIRIELEKAKSNLRRKGIQTVLSIAFTFIPMVSSLPEEQKLFLSTVLGATSLKDIFITFSDEIAELRAVGKSSPFWLMYQWQKKIKI